MNTTTHTQYVTYATPLVSATIRRVDWACGNANTATVIAGTTGAAPKMSAAIASTPGFDANYNVSKDYDGDIWKFKNSGHGGDCITLAKLAVAGLNVIGTSGTPCWTFPSADGTAGFPAVGGSTCTSVTTAQFIWQGQTFNAKLVYDSYNFEGFFTVSDSSGISAYTVGPLGGPYANQTYYYLQVMNAQVPDQFWVWDGDQSVNGVSVTGWTAVPGVAHVPLAPVP
jgi:hypothetical protein